MIWWFLLFLLFVRVSFSWSHATSCPLRECWNGDRVSSQHSLRLTLRDRPQLSQRDDRLIESLVTVRLTNGPFHIPSKENCIPFYSKEKKNLLPIFSPDLTVYGQIWLFCAQKWIFSERLTPFIKAGMNKSLEREVFLTTSSQVKRWVCLLLFN